MVNGFSRPTEQQKTKTPNFPVYDTSLKQCTLLYGTS